MAEWTRVVNDDGGTKVYANLSRITVAGNKAKMWTLSDYNKVQEATNEKFLSRAILNEFDCNEETNRILAIIDYSNNMSLGDVVYSGNGNTEPYPFPPDSVDGILWKVACNKP